MADINGQPDGGAPSGNLAHGTVAMSGSSGTILAANRRRRYITVKNVDASITQYVGTGTVSSSNGMELKAGESITIGYRDAINGIAASGTPNVQYIEESD